MNEKGQKGKAAYAEIDRLSFKQTNLEMNEVCHPRCTGYKLVHAVRRTTDGQADSPNYRQAACEPFLLYASDQDSEYMGGLMTHTCDWTEVRNETKDSCQADLHWSRGTDI